MKIPYRHGDVNLIPANDVKATKTTKHVELTLAHGEQTGHHHTMYPPSYNPGVMSTELEMSEPLSYIEEFEIDNSRYIKIDAGWILKHQEHHALKIAPDTYKIVPEREWDPFASLIKKVVD